MTTEPRITVDNELFLGRLDEQDIFRDALRTVLGPQDEDAPPFIFLLRGEGGMGKSKLTRRFRDIAARESPFESSFHILLVDWELKRSHNRALQVGRDAITTETVFEVLHQAGVDDGWGRHLRVYQKTVEQRREAKQAVARELERMGPETSGGRYAEIRDLGAAVLANLVRLSQPEIGDTGEALIQVLLSAGIQVGAEQAARLRHRADEFLRARLDAKHYDLFRRPEDSLARALAEGLERVSKSRPLVLLLDTYEIVANADPWLRTVIKHAGPRVVWVIAGRPNLAPSRPADRFVGYSAEFPRRLTDWDVRELAIDYVLEYLHDHAPERETTREEAEAIHRATLGVPLAVQAAADLWKKGVSLSAIAEGIPDHTPREEIVRLMTRRVLIHCDEPADLRALYFLAMQRRPDPGTLVAALRPSSDEPFDLTARLDQLARCYSSVRLEGGARLHEASGAFIREYLLTTEVRATDEVRDLARRAGEAARAHREKLEAYLPLLEERCQSEDWTETTLGLAHWLLWRDEYAAWDEILPRFVEGLGYERDLCRGLLEVLEDFEPALGRDGRKRLKLLRAGLGGRLPFGGDAEEERGMLAELTRRAKRAKPADDARDRDHNHERNAILHLRRGKLLHRRKQYDEALASLKRARQYLPAEGEALKQQLGEAFKEVGSRFIWPIRGKPSVQSAEGLQAVQSAVDLYDESGIAHYNLGVALSDFQRHEEAIAAYQRAIELDPDFAYPHNSLGNVYRALGRPEEAIAAYQRTIELDPDFAHPHNGLGEVYRALGRPEEAIVVYERAIVLDPDFAYPYGGLAGVYRRIGNEHQSRRYLTKSRQLTKADDQAAWACLESIAGNVDAALAHLARALERAPGLRAWARHDLDLAFIRDDPRFRELVGEDDRG